MAHLSPQFRELRGLAGKGLDGAVALPHERPRVQLAKTKKGAEEE